jgi:undecaprenyl diphosphate synthase
MPSGLSRDEAELFAKVDPVRLPRHIAVIMDGNGRWARKRHLPRIAGHRAGVKAAHATIETASRIHLPALTLYAFSSENWKRPPTEVSFLMRLLQLSLRQELPKLNEENVRFSYIGRIHELPTAVRDAIEWACETTANNTGMVLTVALNYSAQAEIVDAVNAALAANHNGHSPQVTEQDIADHLYTRDLPELDLVIRTSGELRLSNFLLWQAAYAELYVTPRLWPEFKGVHLLEAIVDYQKRERRYGGLAQPTPPIKSNAAAAAESFSKSSR